MLTISDPYDLKPPDVYRQARTVASKTSRGSDGDWYRDPCDLAFQWHLWFDGGKDVCSATFSRSDQQWRKGPDLPLACLTMGEGVSQILGDALSPTYFGQRPKSLGVILHLADEFALAEVAEAPERSGESGESFDFLRYNLVDSPSDVLADSSASENLTSWRLLPFWGAPTDESTSAAIALPRARETFLSELVRCGEEDGVPVRVAVTCAPVEALAALATLQPDLTGGCLVAIPYLKFTALFVLSETGELRAARSLAHRSGSLVPAGLGQIAWNMAVSAELVGTAGTAESPKILLMSENPRALEESVAELTVSTSSGQEIGYETIDLSGHPALERFPEKRPEFLIYDPDTVERFRAEGAPLTRTATFQALWGGWGSQNFFNTEKIDALYPSRADLRLLAASRWTMFLVGALIVGMGGWGVYSFLTAMRHPSWSLTPEQVAETDAKNKMLIAERTQIETAASLLLPRSQGWASLELLLQMFPEDSGVRLETFSYTIDPSGPATSESAGSDKVGFTREWAFKGVAKPKTMQLLNELNSQRELTAFFERLAQSTGDTSYAPEPTRQVNLRVTEARNPRFNPDSSAADTANDPTFEYPFAFEATVSQTLTERDSLALLVRKPL